MRNEKVKIIIATSAEEMNQGFKRFSPKAETFFGSKENIPFRHLQAAFNNDLSHIIAVDGDDILCSTQSMRDVYDRLKGGSDYVVTRRLPFGLNSFGYSVGFLNSALQATNEKVLETGWGRIFDENQADEIVYSKIGTYENKLRFTLDYEEDLDFFRAVIEQLGDQIYEIDDSSLVSFVLKEKLYKLNAGRVEEYWNNFNSQKERHG